MFLFRMRGVLLRARSVLQVASIPFLVFATVAIFMTILTTTILLIAVTVALRKSAATGIAHFAFGSLLLRRRELLENRLVTFGNTDAGQFLDGTQVLFLVGSAK